MRIELQDQRDAGWVVQGKAKAYFNAGTRTAGTHRNRIMAVRRNSPGVIEAAEEKCRHLVQLRRGR